MHVPSRFIPAYAGNTCSAMYCEPHASGSSPRARGTRAVAPAALVGWRFIPACAGNTKRNIDLESKLAVHPRVRGEHEILDGVT